MDNSIILLNKGGRVKIIKKEKKIFTYNPMYLLIPISCTENIAYIMIKYKKLLDFTHASISITMTSIINYDEEETPFNTIEKKITNIADLINFIHSIDRIKYVNILTNYTVTDFHVDIRVSNISITLYKDKEITYSLNNENLGGNYETIGMLRDIYEPMNNNFVVKKEYYDYLIIKDNEWKFSNKIPCNSLVGLNLSLSNGIYFIKDDEFDKLKYALKNISYEGYIYNIDEINNLIQDEELFESENSIFTEYYYQYIVGYLTSKEAVIEFLIYINYLYNTMLLLYNDILYGYTKYSDGKYIGFDIYLSFSINYLGTESPSDILTIDKLVSPKEFISKIFNSIY